MGFRQFLKDALEARRYRKKKTVTGAEMVESLERHIGRSIDPLSAVFFNGHPISVALVHRIQTQGLRANGSETDLAVIQALTADMMDYCVSTLPLDELAKADVLDQFPIVLKGFESRCPDAALVIGQTLELFLSKAIGRSPGW